MKWKLFLIGLFIPIFGVQASAHMGNDRLHPINEFIDTGNVVVVESPNTGIVNEPAVIAVAPVVHFDDFSECAPDTPGHTSSQDGYTPSIGDVMRWTSMELHCTGKAQNARTLLHSFYRSGEVARRSYRDEGRFPAMECHYGRNA